MSDCFCSTTSAKTKQNCPVCGFTCKSVGMPTLYHQVKFPENQSLVTDSYYYCPTKTCSVGYFSTIGNTIPKQQLRSNHAIQDDAICYCFDISAAQYLAALKNHSAKSIKAFVIQCTKAAECACEIRNPSGQCCLTHFKRFENEST